MELDKIRKRYTELTEEVLGDELLSWAYLLVHGYRNEEDVSEIVSSHRSIEQFAELYGYAVGDPEVIKAYNAYQSAELEYQSRQDYLARKEREAIEQGIEKGIEQERVAVARRLLGMAFDRMQISEIVGLSLSEVDSIADGLGVDD